MDEGESKICENCKREIPVVNYTIHTVHCARNIRMCPVCKEPVPNAELDEHHEKLHKLLPCKQCGEMVCGTDLEDHIRDSCANTVKSCRFCELELARRALPAHETYCGVRTEQCADCRQWVMLKYRQLHLDSNHGFIRLNDDPPPIRRDPVPTRREPPVTRDLPKAINLPTSTNLPMATNLPTASQAGLPPANLPSTSGRAVTNGIKNTNEARDLENINNNNGPGVNGPSSSSVPESARRSGTRVAVKRTNDKPQVNTSVAPTEKVHKDFRAPRGAVKKRPAPPPPARAPPAAPPRPHNEPQYQSAVKRQQQEQADRDKQNAINLAMGLPPVLSAAAKLEKLRKLDALHNRETEPEYRLRRTSPVPSGHLGHLLGGDRISEEEVARRRAALQNLKPMSPQQFVERFTALRLRRDDQPEIPAFPDFPNLPNLPDLPPSPGRPSSPSVPNRPDRFPQIKASLQELRRGLNEVTAPYNSNASANNTVWRPPRNEDYDGELDEERLPCEFCHRPVPAHLLVLHQTGCRPDLAQLSVSPREHEFPPFPAPPPASPPPASPGEPVIPCEFCTQALPVYLIQDHQERCSREANLLYAD